MCFRKWENYILPRQLSKVKTFEEFNEVIWSFSLVIHWWLNMVWGLKLLILVICSIKRGWSAFNSSVLYSIRNLLLFILLVLLVSSISTYSSLLRHVNRDMWSDAVKDRYNFYDVMIPIRNLSINRHLLIFMYTPYKSVKKMT